jgi:mono/diheme cytochrome c family protein
MVATTAFILAFLVLGLSVLFFAFGAGSQRGRGRTPRQTRAGRRFTAVAVGLGVIAFGIAIPAVGIAVNHNRESKNAPGGLRLTSAQQHGREVFATRCGTCHTMRAANTVGKVGPNLDQLRPPKPLVLNAIQMGRARGAGQMPSQLIDGKEADDVAGFIAVAAGR